MIKKIGILAASINAATLALIDAGVAMSDYVCAVTASYSHQTPLLGKSIDKSVYVLLQ
jgi:ribonuclease PH